MRVIPARRGAAVTNRLMILILGLVLVAVCLAAFDWRYDWTGLGWFDRGSAVDLAPVDRVVDASWFAWSAGLAGALLILLGAWWLLANAKPPTQRTTRLRDSNARGTLTVDLVSVGRTLAPRWEQTAPVGRVRATTRLERGRPLIELRSEVDPRADAASLHDAVSSLSNDLATGFPDGEVRCRVLLGSTSTRLLGRNTKFSRVQ